jgi:hypothetical protein
LSVTWGRSVVFFTNKADNITDILLKVTLHIIILTLCNQFLSPLQLWVSEWLLFSGNSAIFQVYHGENKLIFNEMMMRSAIKITYQWCSGYRARHEFGRSVVSSPDRIKPKTIQFVFVVSPLSTHHWGERADTGWIGIRLMCPSWATCLFEDWCFVELALQKSNSACWSCTKRTSSSSHWKLTWIRYFYYYMHIHQKEEFEDTKGAIRDMIWMFINMRLSNFALIHKLI